MVRRPIVHFRHWSARTDPAIPERLYRDFAQHTPNERCGFDLMPELGSIPVNIYLPPRLKDTGNDIDILAPLWAPIATETTGYLGGLDRTLERI